MAQTVVGLFENAGDAQKAAERLQQIGIGSDNIDVTRGGNTDRKQSDNSDDNSVVRFFKSLFGDSDDADRYSRVGNANATIVTVHAQSGGQAERASEILDEAGAMDVDERDEQYRNTRDGDATISRVQEELQVGKREVDGGGVRVRSRIVETPVEETLRLREEHVRVERRDVDRPLSGSDNAAFQEQDIELTERAEVPVVNKEARVVEEITISKDVDERTETIRDTVRNTEVDIDRLDEDNDRSTTSR